MSLFFKRYPNDINRNNTSTEGKAARDTDMNNFTTTLNAVHHYENDVMEVMTDCDNCTCMHK